MTPFKAAAAHVAPVFLAARNGAALIAFPETYIPAFPLWSAVVAPIHNHDWFKRLAASSIRCPGPELERIAGAARRHGVVVSLGFNEGTADSVGCLWNSNVVIGEDGAILNHHRKLVPTFWEKLTWANGDGSGLRVIETRLGRIGMLICGENTNPLARFTLMAQGEQVHVSTYPPVWPTRDPRGGGGTTWPARSASAPARTPSRPRRSTSSPPASWTPPCARSWPPWARTPCACSRRARARCRW